MFETGWKDFCSVNYCPTPSVSQRWAALSWSRRAREAQLINDAWSTRNMRAQPLSSRWRGIYYSVLALSANRLVVAAGNTITSYGFGYRDRLRTSTVELEGTYTVFQSHSDFDITGIEFLPDGGADQTLLVSNVAGDLVRIKLPSPADESGIKEVTKTAQYQIDSKTEKVRSLATSGDIALTLNAAGEATLVNTSDPWTRPATTTVGKVGWSAHLELSSSAPYAAFGTDEHVVVHRISREKLSNKPIHILGGPNRCTPVYCVGQYLPGGRPDIIASGWYDGKVRVHDMRSSRRIGISSGDTPCALTPVMTLSDPWRKFHAIFSIAARGTAIDESARTSTRVGGLSHHTHYLTAGSARHSAVCLWDVRNPEPGWSAYEPGGDNSPVYSLKVEGSRLWAATSGRAFVLDFAPDSYRTTFPRIPANDIISTSTYVHQRGVPPPW
jgi:hypothetical protein